MELREYPIEYLSVAPWSFLSEDIVSLLDQVKDKCQQLEEISDIFVGPTNQCRYDIYYKGSKRGKWFDIFY